MSFRAIHAVVTYVLAGLGLFALTFGGELTAAATGVLALGFVASMLVPPAWRRWATYHRAWNVAVVLVLAIQVLRGAFGAPPLALGIEFAAVLQLSRLSTSRVARDYQQIVVIAFLHVIAGTVLSSDLEFGVVYVCFSVVVPWMLALAHLRGEMERRAAEVDTTGGGGDAVLERALAARGLVGGRYLAGTALLSLPVFGATVLLFLAFPRVGMGFMSLERRAGQPVAGFGQDVELGGFGTIRDNPTVVLRVRPKGLPSPPPPRLELRMRGTSFDHYDGRRWTRTLGGPQRLPRMMSQHAISRWGDRERDLAYEIVLDPLEEPVVFLPERTVALSLPERIQDGEGVRRVLTMSPGLEVRYEQTDSLGLTYTAFAARTAEASDLLPHREQEAYLRLPPEPARLVAFAHELTAGARDARERVARILHVLRDSGGYRYTLEQPDPGAAPPLEAFLFEAKRGHCEYFATALAVLLRATGVPTRNVTGFVGGTYNEYGQYYSLRQGDAHSWVEAYLPGEGWVTLDPTPPARGAMAPPETAWSTVAALIDALRVGWSRLVVQYDLRAQAAMFERARRWFRSFGESSRRRFVPEGRAPDEPAAPRPSGWARALGPAAAVAVTVVVLALVLVWSARRRRGRADPAVRLYRSLERRLRRRGLVRAPSETPSEHAAALAGRGVAGAAVVQEITDHYLVARYGGRPIPRADHRRLRAALGRL